MANISSDAQKVLERAGTGAKQYVLNKGGFGGKLTSGEATRLLQGFKVDPNNVLSTGNAKTSNPRPDDLLGIKKQIDQRLGVTDLQRQFQDAFKQLRQFDVTTLEQQRQIENRLAGASTITGAQARANQLRSQERLGIATEAEVLQSQLQAAQQQSQFEFGIRADEVAQKRQLILQYPGAGITFGDSFQQAAKKIQKFQDEQEEEARDQAKKDAFDQLYLQTFGTDRGNLSRREARKKLEKRIGKEEADAEEERLLDMAIKRKALSGDSDDSEKEAQVWETASNLQNRMSDKKINWKQAFETMATAYQWLSVDEIDKILGYSYRDKYDK